MKKNGEIIFVTKDGITSASRTAPVDTGLHVLFELLEPLGSSPLVDPSPCHECHVTMLLTYILPYLILKDVKSSR